MGFRRHKSFVACVLFCLALAMLVFYDLRVSYLQEESDTHDRLANTSYLIAEWIKGFFLTSDYVLRDIVSQVPITELRYPALDQTQHASRMEFLETKRQTLPNVFTIGLYNGQCIATHTKTIAGFDASQREYCRLLKENPQIDSIVTNSFFSSLGPLNVVQARRFPGKSQEFPGFVLIGISMDSFFKWLEPISVGRRGNIAIFDSQMHLLARKPVIPETVGKTVKGPSIQSFIASNENFKILNITSTLDGESRLSGVRRVDHLPFIVAVGESNEEWLEHWRSRVLGEVFATLLLWGMAIFIVSNHWTLAERSAELEAANRKLAALSATDGLTGIANRRRFDEILAREWATAKRTTHPLTVAMLDVDFFKAFNDRYGHQAGDQCLKNVGAALLACTQRATDLVARYGGEEFALVLPGCNPEAALCLAEIARKSIESLDILHEGAPAGKVTVSIGIATHSGDGSGDAATLLRAADGALYRAKQAGRNQVQAA